MLVDGDPIRAVLFETNVGGVRFPPKHVHPSAAPALHFDLAINQDSFKHEFPAPAAAVLSVVMLHGIRHHEYIFMMWNRILSLTRGKQEFCFRFRYWGKTVERSEDACGQVAIFLRII